MTTNQDKYPKNGNEGEHPYKNLKSRKKVYHDELELLTLLDQPTYSKPIEVESIWKKISNIPKERRHRLLQLLTPKHIERMWIIAGGNLADSKSSQIDPSNIFLGPEREFFLKPISWSGTVYNVIWPFSLISRFFISNFQKHFFRSIDGRVYGRVKAGGKIISWILPTYLEAREVRKVLFTEEPCPIALVYGDGQLHLSKVPQNFPMPGKVVWPLSDATIDYIRPVGPDVVVGQCWIEGIDPNQVPRKICDFIMIKDHENQ